MIIKTKKGSISNLVILILSIFFVYGTYKFFSKKVIPTKRLVSGPTQTSTDAEKWKTDDYEFTPLAEYTIEARILGTERYYMDGGSKLSPIDLALGWGEMADPDIYKKLSISQGGRWYRYSWGSDGPPISPNEIIKSSANTHLIPANNKIKSKLLDLNEDEVVTLTGLLIQINKADGWNWESSLSREDSGGKSCELMWVESVVKSAP